MPGEERLQGTFQYLKGACNKDRGKIFIEVFCDRTREDGFKLKEGQFILDLRKKCFTMMVVTLE